MDIELFYREKGSGETLVLLHGNGEEDSYFVHQIDHFQTEYRVLALDTFDAPLGFHLQRSSLRIWALSWKPYFSYSRMASFPAATLTSMLFTTIRLDGP